METIEFDAGQFLAMIRKHRITKAVAVPEYGDNVVVTVAGFSSDGREWYFTRGQQIRDDQSATKGLRADVLARQILNAQGERAYGDDEARLLGEMPDKIAERLFAAVLELSGLLPGAVEAAAKNSESDPSDALHLPSLSGSE